MDMILDATNANQLAFALTDNAANVSVERSDKLRDEERGTVLGAEDDVGVEARKRLWYGEPRALFQSLKIVLFLSRPFRAWLKSNAPLERRPITRSFGAKTLSKAPME
jgi:hypothetical protein